jgi:D-serine deaminase-like pyridoxal phosphate-dependent protein
MSAPIDALAELDTPALLIDLDRLERNLRDVAERAGAHGKRLRPHIKTHKMIEIARRQVELGAVGLTVAKLGEAEVLADAGFTDLFVCYPIVGAVKLRRLVALAERVKVSTIADDIDVARALAAAARAAGLTIDVLVKLDLGMHRIGVRVEDAEALATGLAGLDGLAFRGVCIHEGVVYGEPDPVRRRALARDQVSRLAETGARLRAAGLTVDVVSCGATPAFRDVVDIEGITEMRPGNYVFYDAMQVALGVVPADRCALSVLTTVVSHAAPDRAVVDAGAKALTVERGAHGLDSLSGYGQPLGRGGITIAGLSEEHGWLRLDPPAELAVGTRLQVTPNHACTTVNCFDTAAVIRDGDVVARWAVAARGRMT